MREFDIRREGDRVSMPVDDLAYIMACLGAQARDVPQGEDQRKALDACYRAVENALK